MIQDLLAESRQFLSFTSVFGTLGIRLGPVLLV